MASDRSDTEPGALQGIFRGAASKRGKSDIMADIESHRRIAFAYPDLTALIKKYAVVDLHFHSRYSDGFNDIAAIAKRARKLGIGIAITDHNRIGGAVEIDRYRDVFSIPGIEITSKEGAHLLVYFYEVKALEMFYSELAPYVGREILASTALSMESIIACAREYRSVIIFPHPYCAVYTGICNPMFSEKRQEALIAMVDGIEAINAGNLHRWNLESALLGFNMDMGLTAGSDGHNLFQMGRAVTYAACKKKRAAFLDAVKEKRSRAIGKEINLLRKVTSNSVKFPSNIKNSQEIMGKNVRYGYAVINHKSRQFRENMQRIRQNRTTLKKGFTPIDPSDAE